MAKGLREELGHPEVRAVARYGVFRHPNLPHGLTHESRCHVQCHLVVGPKGTKAHTTAVHDLPSVGNYYRRHQVPHGAHVIGRQRTHRDGIVAVGRRALQEGSRRALTNEIAENTEVGFVSDGDHPISGHSRRRMSRSGYCGGVPVGFGSRNGVHFEATGVIRWQAEQAHGIREGGMRGARDS